MSFDTEKDIYGNRLAAGVAIYPNACRYTVDGALDKRDVSISSSVAAGFTGVVTVSGGDPLFFQTSNPYLKLDNEIIKITVTSATEIEIISRGQFGTTDTDHGTPNAKIVHGGEADGSCVGYLKRPDGNGCSTNDSFSRAAEREFLFTTSQSFNGQVHYNGLTLKGMAHNPSQVYPGEKAAKNSTYSISIQDNKIVEVKSKKNLNILDLTGAGDLFASGYLHGYIKNLSQVECLEKGTEMSAKIIQQIGARL